MYLHKTPFWLKSLFPTYIWHKQRTEKNIYLTFDDGPIPVVTDFVLKQLAIYNAKATFFCVGDNVKKNPAVFRSAVDEGHRVGNHTFNHLDGWKTRDSDYVDNILECRESLNKHVSNQPLNLFRPPYGKIKKSQAKILNKEFEIVMWDVLSGDFDISLNKENCLFKTIKATNKGSIVIFHDSIKAEENLRFVLPSFLSHFTEAGYVFQSL